MDLNWKRAGLDWTSEEICYDEGGETLHKLPTEGVSALSL